jgi:hypothetical protein
MVLRILTISQEAIAIGTICFSKELSEDPFYFPIKEHCKLKNIPQLKHMTLIILSLSDPAPLKVRIWRCAQKRL